MLSLTNVDITIEGLLQHYRRGDFSPKDLISALVAACDAQSGNPIWITRLQPMQLETYLEALAGKNPDQLPLYGIPFAIKDNIDLAGVPTTAACEAFTYTPSKSATVVDKLITAGAIPLGKTNLDQFATGLVGTRSPWGACRNAFNPDYISGGSSAGSAVAVAQGLVSFALGTDTAGSGRVPAMLNNLVGLKPTKGLISTRGVVPACRSLDCVSIFALTSDDANRVFNAAVEFDPEDAYARPNVYGNGQRYYQCLPQKPKIGVPAEHQLQFFGDNSARELFERSLQILSSFAELVTIDLEPFTHAAQLLYQGPWVTERYLATQELFDDQPETLLPVLQKILRAGTQMDAAQTFAAQYQLQAYKQQALAQLSGVDAIVVPTAPTAYTIDEVEKNPIGLNSNMGFYTNFMNLLDCTGVAVTTGFLPQGPGFGVTFFHQAFSDKRLLGLAAQMQNALGLPVGALDRPLAPQGNGPAPTKNFIKVVVCGAHLQGLPLNWQLVERGGELLETTQTSAKYRFFALAGGPPKRPGLVRDEHNGVAIDVEVWQIPAENFGSFVAEIPQPLGIGKVELADGRWEPGFICENAGLEGATEITEFGSWRRYMQSLTS